VVICHITTKPTLLDFPFNFSYNLSKFILKLLNMPQKQMNSNKISLIRNICSQAIIDIDEIKKKRDKKIKELLKTIDAKHIAKAIKDIKNIK
jgi:hypothetical protein